MILPGLPAWLAPDASPALAVRRPLRQLARPVGRRPVRRVVAFAAVPPPLVDGASRALAQHVAHEAGPIACGPVAVVVFRSREAVADGLARVPLCEVPVGRLNAALGMYDEAVAELSASALLVASCPVLWPQIRTRVTPWSGLS